MAFGQTTGPPARASQLRELQELLERAGFTDFRDARGQMGFTQRQAGGKFTNDEAQAFIDDLLAAEHAAGPDGPSSADGPVRTPAPRRATAPSTAMEKSLAKATDHALAAELQSRGWVVMEP